MFPGLISREIANSSEITRRLKLAPNDDPPKEMTCWLSGEPLKATPDHQHAVFFLGLTDKGLIFGTRREGKTNRRQISKKIFAKGVDNRTPKGYNII
jgi:hypothetical protein